MIAQSESSIKQQIHLLFIQIKPAKPKRSAQKIFFCEAVRLPPLHEATADRPLAPPPKANKPLVSLSLPEWVNLRSEKEKSKRGLKRM